MLLLRVSIVIAIVVLLVLLYAEFKPLQKRREVVKLYYIESKILQFRKSKMADVIPINRRRVLKED